MGRTSAKNGETNMAEMTRNDDTEVIDADVRPADESQVAVYAPVSDTQHRRLLTAPELMQWVERAASGDVGFDQASILDAFAKAAAAFTQDELLRDAQATHGRDIPGVMLRVDNIKFQLGQYEDGCPYFGVLFATRTDTDRSDVISIGGWKAIPTLGQMHYLCSELTVDSPYLVAPDAPGAVEKWDYPQFLKIKRIQTGRGFHVNAIVHPLLP